ncbi:MAG TPA: hypothetical protein VGC87_26795 [Pyrinomonadaceae bacterium]|jgi:hypothetical protein
MPQGIKAIGFAWYKPEHYDEMRRLSADGKTQMPSTYKQWLKKAQDLFDRLKREGHTVEKVYIEPDTFPAWCAERGLQINAQARIRFADEFVARKYTNRNR